jgi:ABC-type nickel/cobalt efflux system permease component RcnA
VKRLLLFATAVVATFLALPAGAAHAHPLGKFSVNQSVQLTLRPDRIDGLAVVDLAELPTLADRPTASAERTCADLAARLSVTVDGVTRPWQVESATLAYAPGAAGLETSRFDCALTTSARLRDGTAITVVNGYLPDRVGWRELVAIGAGLDLDSGGLPTTSPSDGLRGYPQDLLASPLDTRSATIHIGSAGSAARAGQTTTTGGLSWTARAERTLGNLTGGDRLTFLGALLAVGLAALLGAAHAALPGHGKTIMAAYLAGRSGRARDAVAVGATVTITHTVGVLVLGLLITGVAGIAGEQVLRGLGIASGALVVAVGVGLLARSRHHHHHHHHTGTHKDRLSVAGLGVAGGLVPSPTALVVLLAAIGLDRGAFGVALVLAYGAGMAATLTAAGLLLLELRRRGLDRLRRPGRWAHRLQHALPTATAALILAAGVGIVVRGVAAFG